MEKFKFEPTQMQGLTLIHPFIVSDERGTFIKTYEKEIFLKHNIIFNNAEDIMSISKKGVIRGLHFQLKYPQDKLVRVVSGEVFDVVVDLRKDSDTFGKWQGFYLSATNKQMLYIPKGFAHGFLALSEDVRFCYRCGELYYPQYDCGINWKDENLNIEWPLERVKKTIVSAKDEGLMSFEDFCKEYKGL